MATIPVEERRVRLVRLDESMPPGTSGEPLNRGDSVTLDNQGRYVRGAGSGMSMQTVIAANQPVSVLKEGIVDLGEGLQSLNFEAEVFGAPDGTLDDAAGTDSGTAETVSLGRVMQGLGQPDGRAKKLLRVSL